LVASSTGYAFNRTRHACLATHLTIAGTYWSRFRGLMCTDEKNFGEGNALWIVPCRGVHTLAMRFPIDVLYLDAKKFVVHMEENLKPWRMARISLKAASVLELPGKSLRASGTMVGDEIEIALGQTREMNTA
jgi:uncharacterized protein